MDITLATLALSAGYVLVAIGMFFLFVMMFMTIPNGSDESWNMPKYEKMILYPWMGLLLSVFPGWLAHGYSLLGWIFGSDAPWSGAETLPVAAYWLIASVIGGTWIALLRSKEEIAALIAVVFFFVQTAWLVFGYAIALRMLS